MSRLTYNPDTRIAQTLIAEDRMTKGQLEAALTKAREYRRIAIMTSTDRTKDIVIDILDHSIATIEIDILCRYIEDEEFSLIAFQNQIEYEDSEGRYPLIVKRLRSFVEDSEFTLSGFHSRLAYKLSERASAGKRILSH